MIEVTDEQVAPRISILDAKELDFAIFGVLKSQTDHAAKYIPSWILNKFGLEFETLLKLLIWKFSIGRHQASFGQQLLHLKYSKKSRNKRLKVLAILTIGGPYFKEKLVQYMNDQNNFSSRNLPKLFEDIETAIKILDFLTFIRFLLRGGAPTFIEFILQLNPVSTVPQSRRNVGYSYMMRELIWHGFIELLLIFLPLVNYHRLKNKISRIFNGKKSNKTDVKDSIFTSSSLCEICREPPILPYQMGCAHSFCYLCLASNREADKCYECPGCGFSNPETSCMVPVLAS